MLRTEMVSNIVGAENISTDPAVLENYAQSISFVKPIRPGCVIKVNNAEEILQVVKIANDSGTPLVPISSGPPHFRGDSVPSVAEAALVDLSGMKKIIRVDRHNRVAMCEPGVTFAEMIAAVNKEGLRLNMPLLPRSTKSVVASLLEREPAIMPKYHWDICDPMGCLEVIFGSGDLFRTGEAAGPGTLEEQWEAGGSQKEASGPAQVSWHRLVSGSQGSMGIVTWASMRCELLPKVEDPFWVGSASLVKVMKMAQELIKLRMVNECFILNNTNLATIAVENKEASKRLKNSFPPWVLFFTIAGYEYFPELRVTGQKKDMYAIAQKFGLEAKKSMGKVSAREFLALIQRPSGAPYWKMRARGCNQDLFFLSNYNKVPELVDVMNRVALKAGYPVSEMGVYVQPIVQGVNYHVEFNLPYDPESSEETAQVKSLLTQATRALMAQGAFFSRPYGENSSLIMNRDAGTVWALKKVKEVLDPGNIMNPGKLCF